MDAYLDQAWRTGQPPFHGVTIAPANSLALVTLRSALEITANWIEQRYTPRNVLVLPDWHVHDGFVKAAEPATWADVRRTFSDERALAASKTNDYQIFVAVYPSTADWLLRWYLDDGELDLEGGDFSVSVSNDDAASLINPLQQCARVKVHSSPEWFAHLYGG